MTDWNAPARYSSLITSVKQKTYFEPKQRCGLRLNDSQLKAGLIAQNMGHFKKIINKVGFFKPGGANTLTQYMHFLSVLA